MNVVGGSRLGRKKSYIPEEKLEAAIELFLTKGYASTSISDLVEHLGLNRKSLYAEFGSKQELFDAALQMYDRVFVSQQFAPLEAPNAGRAEIVGLVEMFAANARTPLAGRGCLLCNTAVERAPLDPGSQLHVARHVERICSAFENALIGGQRKGDFSDSMDPSLEARFLTSHVIGQITLIRANVAPEVVESGATVVLSRLEAL